jgi:hypothetical protein
MAAPTNVYYLIDDYANSAGVNASLPGAGGSGKPISPEFTAPSAAAAITVAHIIASALQRPVRVVLMSGGSPPYTLVQAALANVALTSVPSGVSY